MIADSIVLFLMVGAGVWSARLSLKSAIENSDTPLGCIRYVLWETYLVTGMVFLLYALGLIDSFALVMFSVRMADLLIYDYPKLMNDYHTLKQGKN